MIEQVNGDDRISLDVPWGCLGSAFGSYAPS